MNLKKGLLRKLSHIPSGVYVLELLLGIKKKLIRVIKIIPGNLCNLNLTKGIHGK
jgi:hypothetical protein